MRPVEKAAPALSDPVGGSVSCVLGLDALLLGDDGVSSGGVLYLSSLCSFFYNVPNVAYPLKIQCRIYTENPMLR